VIRTETPSAREELERLVHDYRHIREEHRRARRGSGVRRRLGAQLLELDTRFERVLAALPLDEATRSGWRDHLRRHGAEPAAPGEAEPLVLQRGAAVSWPGAPAATEVSVQARGDIPAGARADLERTLVRVAELSPRPVLHARGVLERLADPALERPIVASASLDLGAHTVRAHAEAASPADAIDLLETRLRRAELKLSERETAVKRGRAR